MGSDIASAKVAARAQSPRPGIRHCPIACCTVLAPAPEWSVRWSASVERRVVIAMSGKGLAENATVSDQKSAPAGPSPPAGWV